jgi:hypothetical protein
LDGLGDGEKKRRRKTFIGRGTCGTCERGEEGQFENLDKRTHHRHLEKRVRKKTRDLLRLRRDCRLINLPNDRLQRLVRLLVERLLSLDQRSEILQRLGVLEDGAHEVDRFFGGVDEDFFGGFDCGEERVSTRWERRRGKRRTFKTSLLLLRSRCVLEVSPRRIERDPVWKEGMGGKGFKTSDRQRVE